MARGALSEVHPVEQEHPSVACPTQVAGLPVAVEEARRRARQRVGQGCDVASQVVDGGGDVRRRALGETLPSLERDLGDGLGPAESPFPLDGRDREKLPTRRVGEQMPLVAESPRARAESRQRVDQRRVRVPIERVVAGSHQLIGHVAHQQRRAPAVAPVTGGRRQYCVVDDVVGQVVQAGGKGPQGAAPRITRNAHGEVAVEMDVLDDAALAVDRHLLER